MKLQKIFSLFIGTLLVGCTTWLPILKQNGFESIGAIAGIILVIFSLFGELPAWLSWTTRLGSFLYSGVVLATILLLFPLLSPSKGHESSFFAFSPTVWAAYLSIVFVGISFETSSLPKKIYTFCKKLHIQSYILIPLYVIVAGLLGNILDGVSIVIISSVILINLLPFTWTIKSLFALLFGGLVSNLITVAAEPTNIKFQEVLAPLFKNIHPSFWITNWTICVLGILFPAVWLGIIMKKEKAKWKEDEPNEIHVFQNIHEGKGNIDIVFSSLAMIFLATGVVIHAILENISTTSSIPLWLLLLPAGITAVLHLFLTNTLDGAVKHVKEQSPVWVKLVVIFSLLWYLQNGLTETKSILNMFFLLPSSIQYILLVILSLGSAVTDNVALAAMQGSIIIAHPFTIWKIRLLLVLLTWAGGLTPFGCLQSLSINHRLKLTTAEWIKETPIWAGLAIIGGLSGLLLITFLYPTAVGLP